MKQPEQGESLKKTLSPIMLWGLGVGYVISGMYFGWNAGFKEGGTLGMAIAILFSIAMYATFSFSYSELACAIPKAGGTETSDSPLPLAMAKIVGDNSFLFHMLITIGLFGLVASFHGLILAGGRATFEFGRTGFAPSFLGKVNTRFQTPAFALIANMTIGILALVTGKTDQIIILSVFGALTLYIIAMLSLFALRSKEPVLNRPFRVPFYPLSPLIALVIATFSIIVMTYYNLNLALIYFSILALAFFIFKAVKTNKD